MGVLASVPFCSLVLLVPSRSSLRVLFSSWFRCSSSSVALLSGVGSRGLLAFLSSSLAGCHFYASALFLASASFHRYLVSILPWFHLLTFLLSLRSLPFPISVSLASVSFALVFFSGTSLLHSCTCPCFSVLACGLLGPYSWSSFGFCRQCFLVPLLRNSVESQYPLRRGPPFGPSCLIALFLVVRVLTAFGLCCSSVYGSGRWFPSSSPSASFVSHRSLAVPLFLYLPGAFPFYRIV